MFYSAKLEQAQQLNGALGQFSEKMSQLSEDRETDRKAAAALASFLEQKAASVAAISGTIQELASAVDVIKERFRAACTAVEHGHQHNWASMFAKFDQDSSGELDEEEFTAAALELTADSGDGNSTVITQADIDHVFGKIDIDNTQSISFEEFEEYFVVDESAASELAAAEAKFAEETNPDLLDEQCKEKLEVAYGGSGQVPPDMMSIMMQELQNMRLLMVANQAQTTSMLTDVQKKQAETNGMLCDIKATTDRIEKKQLEIQADLRKGVDVLKKHISGSKFDIPSCFVILPVDDGFTELANAAKGGAKSALSAGVGVAGHQLAGALGEVDAGLGKAAAGQVHKRHGGSKKMAGMFSKLTELVDPDKPLESIQSVIDEFGSKNLCLQLVCQHT